MTSSLTVYITLMSFSGIINLFLCLYVFNNKKHMKGSTTLILYTLALTIYCFGNAFGLTSSTIEQVMFWTTIQYIGLPFAPPLGLLIVLQFLGKEISKKRIYLLFIIPIISFILVATNHLHNLYYKSFIAHTELDLPYIEIEIGLWYVVQGIFTSCCLLLAIILLINRLFSHKEVYRLQLVVLLIGQLLPMLTSFLYLLGVTPNGIDIVPIVMWLTSGLYIGASYSSNLFLLSPIAKATVFNQMKEGVIVCDHLWRLNDFNCSAQSMIPCIQSSMIGQSIETIWMRIFGCKLPVNVSQEQASFDFTMESDNHLKYFQARISLISQRNQQLAGYLILIIGVTEQKLLQQQLELQAHYDDLTKVHSRSYFYKAANEQLQHMKHEQAPFSLIFFDIDHFKQVNDSYGHDIGDQLLVHVANVCKENLPSDAILARYGGEEFLIALPGFDQSMTLQLAEQLRLAIRSKPLIVQNREIIVTASFGITQADFHKQTSVERLIHIVDKALYEAKRKGRDQVVTI